MILIFFLDHPNEQQGMYALTEKEIILIIRQEHKGDSLNADSTEVQKVS